MQRHDDVPQLSSFAPRQQRHARLSGIPMLHRRRQHGILHSVVSFPRRRSLIAQQRPIRRKPFENFAGSTKETFCPGGGCRDRDGGSRQSLGLYNKRTSLAFAAVSRITDTRILSLRNRRARHYSRLNNIMSRGKPVYRNRTRVTRCLSSD